MKTWKNLMAKRIYAGSYQDVRFVGCLEEEDSFEVEELTAKLENGLLSLQKNLIFKISGLLIQYRGRLEKRRKKTNKKSKYKSMLDI